MSDSCIQSAYRIVAIHSVGQCAAWLASPGRCLRGPGAESVRAVSGLERRNEWIASTGQRPSEPGSERAPVIPSVGRRASWLASPGRRQRDSGPMRTAAVLGSDGGASTRFALPAPQRARCRTRRCHPGVKRRAAWLAAAWRHYREPGAQLNAAFWRDPGWFHAGQLTRTPLQSPVWSVAWHDPVRDVPSAPRPSPA